MSSSTEATFEPRRAALRQQVAAHLPDADVDGVELLLWTVRLGRLMELLSTQLLAEGRGLDTSARAVLTTLMLSGPPHELSPTHLARVVVQTSGGMTKTLRRLEAEGLVKRARSPEDGRMMTVVLTDAGRAAAGDALGQMVGAWQALLAGVSNGEKARSLDALAPIISALEAATGMSQRGGRAEDGP